MGSKGSAPSYNPPPPPKLPTADEIYASATNYAKANQPFAFGAREGLLQDFATPESTNQFFNAFQPSSFEQALANQNFSNILPESENRIKAYLSQSGIANSPVTARLLGDNYNKLAVDVGSFLSNQANNRALQNIGTRNIDPNSITSPFINTAVGQSNNQANLDYNYQQQLAQAQYQQAMQQYQQRQGMFGALGTGLGAGAGFLIGGPAGAALGAGIGGAASPLFGGGASPVNFADSLALYNQLNNRLPGYGANTPRGTYDMGNYSLLPNRTAIPVWGTPRWGG